MIPASVLGSVAIVCPTTSTVEGVSVEVLNTGWVNTDWRHVVSHGRRGAARLPLLVGHVEHPSGDVLIDTGVGLTTRSGSFPKFPLKTRNIDVPKGYPIVEQVAEPPQTVLMTHLHFDHIGGLLDLPPTTDVWTTEDDWISTSAAPVGFPSRRLKERFAWTIQPLRAGNSGRVLGRPAVDVRGDGTIWYLSTPGHTPGSASVLVRGTSNVWLFVGDIAWVDQHLEKSGRPKWVSVMVDARPRLQRESLNWVRHIYNVCPEIKIVAGHEPKWVKTQP